MRVFTEAAGSPVWPSLLHALRGAAFDPVATDIDPLAVGFYLVNRRYVVPPGFGDEFFVAASEIIAAEQVKVVLPSLDEGLHGWALRREAYSTDGVTVLVSDPETIEVFGDKWLTYLFFRQHKIPTPDTSLRPEYDLIKPRRGRGSVGVHRHRPDDPHDMQGKVSQRFIDGQEYTIDVLCDFTGRPIYVVPRMRVKVESGISVAGQTVADVEIECHVRAVCDVARFRGPVSFQCIRAEGAVFFTEVNARVSGGLALSMAATENWFAVVRRLLDGDLISPGPVQAGLVMVRYHSEVFVPYKDVIRAD